MKKFEYCFYRNNLIQFSNGQTKDIVNLQLLKNVLDNLGKDGWEMVGCGSTGEADEGVDHSLYFKREICG